MRLLALAVLFANAGDSATRLPSAGRVMQESQPKACTLTASSSPVRLGDGSQVILDPSTMAGNGSQMLVLGTPTTLWPVGARRGVGPRSQTEAIGVVVDTSGRAVIVPPPLERQVLHGRAVAAGPGEWDVLFFTTDVTPRFVQHEVDSATLWVGRFDGRRWTNVRRVADVTDARLLPDHSPALVRHRGELRFAYAFIDRPAAGARAYQPSGIVMLRERSGRWRADTLIVIAGAPRSVHLVPAGDSATMAIYSAWNHFRVGGNSGMALFAATHQERWEPWGLFARHSSKHLDALHVSASPRGWGIAWRQEVPLFTDGGPDSLQWGRLRPDSTLAGSATIDVYPLAGLPTVLEFRGGRTLLVSADHGHRTLRAYLAGDADVTLLSQFAAPVSLPRLRSVVLDDQRAALWTTSEGADESEPYVASHVVLLRLQCDATRARQGLTPARGRGNSHASDSKPFRAPGPVGGRDHRLP